MSDGPDLLERTRMALADCGIDPLLVEWSWSTDGAIAVDEDATEAQIHMAWRALELADTNRRSYCWACTESIDSDEDWDRVAVECMAFRPLMADCGVDR